MGTKQMKTYRISGQSRGTQILIDGADRAAFSLVGDIEALAWRIGITRRAFLPSMVDAECYSGSPGQQMRVEGPSAATVLCPERTDQARRLFRETDCPSFYYIERCFRLERPQAGRLREFTQFGVEIRDPVPQMIGPYIDCVLGEIHKWCPSAVLVDGVERGSSYYSGAGFEIEVPELGAQKQVCGGGPYPEGWGFAIGIERLLLAMEKQ